MYFIISTWLDEVKWCDESSYTQFITQTQVFMIVSELNDGACFEMKKQVPVNYVHFQQLFRNIKIF